MTDVTFCSGSLALASLDRACRNLVSAFPQRSPPRLLLAAACGGLRSAPDHRTRRALLRLSYSCAPPMTHAALVTHVESPGGISPPGAPRTVRDPLESHGSRCSAVASGTALPRPRAPPVSSWPVAKAEPRSPFAPAHYRAFDTTTGCSAPAPRFGTLALAVGAACGLSLHVLGRDEAQVLTVPYESLVELRAAYMPDAARAVSGHPPS